MLLSHDDARHDRAGYFTLVPKLRLGNAHGASRFGVPKLELGNQ